MASKSIAKSFFDTIELRQGGIINASEVRALCRYWSKVERSGKWDQDLWDRFCECSWIVDDESRDLGHMILSKKLILPNGLLRKTKLTKEWSDERGNRIRHCLHTMDHIRFWGCEALDTGRCAFYPKYRVFAKDMNSFGYIAVPWQTGEFIFTV